MTNLVLAFEYMNLSTFPNAGIWMVICLKATSKNSTFRNDRRTFLKLLCALRFFLKSFCFFLNRIARYAQSKESRNLSSKIPQITCKAIFKSYLKFLLLLVNSLILSKVLLCLGVAMVLHRCCIGIIMPFDRIAF